MKQIWEHLENENNRKRLAFLGTFIVALIVAGWTLLQYSDKKSIESSRNMKIEVLDSKLEVLTQFVKVSCTKITSGNFDSKLVSPLIKIRKLSNKNVKVLISKSSKQNTPVEATFSAPEWSDVLNFIHEHKAIDNQSYSSCIDKRTPIFLEKFEFKQESVNGS